MRRKVLVADDEEGVLALLHGTVGNHEQCQVLLAQDGEEALRLAVKEKPDLIFLDIVMPQRDGYEVCQTLKKNADTTDIKIIMLTALGQESDRRKAVEAGADGYLTKPFSPTAVLEKVDEVLSG